MQQSLFVLSLMSTLFQLATPWHAFMGQEAIPTLPNTNLVASLELPSTPFLATELAPDKCSIAITSFQKLTTANVCMYGQYNCSLPCATAWESFLRDFQSAAQNSSEAVCRQLLLQLSSWPNPQHLTFPSTNWLNIEQSLSQQCQSSVGYNCPTKYCSLSFQTQLSCSYSTQLLQPLDCQSFTATDGVYQTPFLTWAAMAYYQRNGLGAVGGLDLVADDEHGTWACMYATECGLSVADLTCFRYSQVRGEFNFWGYNSQLSLLPSILTVNVSFCSMDNKLRLAKSDPKDNNKYTSADVTYAWADQNLEGNVVLSGALLNLGLDGCGFFQLIRNRSWSLSIHIPGYYVWTGLYYIGQKNQRVGIGLQYELLSKMGTSLRIVLNWHEIPANYDIWMTVPGDASQWGLGGSFAAVSHGYTRAERISCFTGDSVRCSGANISLSADVNDGFGPETISIDGKLIPGIYGIYVNLPVDPSNPQKIFETDLLQAPFVDVYSEIAEGLVLTLSPSSNTAGSAGNWWLAFNIVVVSATDTSTDQCVSIQVVDQFVTANYDSGVVTGLNTATQTEDSMTLYCLSNDNPFGSRKVFIDVRSATNQDMPVQNVRVGITPLQSHLSPYFSGALDSIRTSERELIYGSYSILIDAPLFISLNQSFTISAESSAEQTFFMVPMQAATAFVVLRWPQTPVSLDLYVMPLGMEASWVDVNQQPIGDPASVARAYAGGDLNTIIWLNTQTKVSETVIMVERYQATHSVDNVNGPQVISVRNAVPGQYRVFVSIPPLAECLIPNQQNPDGNVDPVFSLSDDIQLDIYIANALAETATLKSDGGKWWYAGYLFVSETPTTTWNVVEQILLDDPLTLYYSSVQLSMIDAVTFTAATDYSTARYSMYLSGLCECPLGTSVCNCIGHVLATGAVGPNSLVCTEESCPDQTWLQDRSSAVYVPRDRTVYQLKVTLDGYFDRYVDVDAYLDAVVQVVMVPITAPGELRAVLTWALMPLDLDLWLIPVGDISGYTYWDNQGPNDGVRLERDATDGYGPEVITMTAQALPGIYRLAVNVYSYNNNLDNVCLGTDECEFLGGETVEIFVGSALIDISVFNRIWARNAAVLISSSWWLVSEIQVTGVSTAPLRTYQLVAGTENEMTTCADLMTDEAGTCRGEYCCDGCTSRCGACDAACAPEVQLLLNLTDAIAFTPATDYSDVVYIFYAVGACSCRLGSGNCTCAGDALSAGLIGLDLTPCRRPTALSNGSCPDTQWNSMIRLTQEDDGVMWTLVIRKQGYLDRIADVSLSEDSSLLVIMIPLPPPGNLTIVLTWGATPLDLDLWIISSTLANNTYWGDRGPHAGVFLDGDAQKGFGPETVSLWATAALPRERQNDTFMVAVNVYSANGDDSCTKGDVCQFAGGETVTFVASYGIQAQYSIPRSPPPGDGSWWPVATVSRNSGGFNVTKKAGNVDTNIATTTCESLLMLPSQACDPTSYCCNSCTSHCYQRCTCYADCTCG